MALRDKALSGKDERYKTFVGVPLMRTGIQTDVNGREHHITPEWIDKIVYNTNRKGFDTAINFGPHTKDDIKEYYIKNEEENTLTPIFGAAHTLRREPDPQYSGEFLLVGDITLPKEFGDIPVDKFLAPNFPQRSIVVSGEGDKQWLSSVALLGESTPAAVKDLTPWEELSSFQKWVEENDTKQKIMFTAYGEKQEPRKEGDIMSEKDKVAELREEVEKTRADYQKQYEQALAGLQAERDTLREQVEALKKANEERKAQFEAMKMDEKRREIASFCKSLADGGMAESYVNDIRAILVGMDTDPKGKIMFQEKEIDTPIEALKMMFSSMVKNPKTVFVPKGEEIKDEVVGETGVMTTEASKKFQASGIGASIPGELSQKIIEDFQNVVQGDENELMQALLDRTKKLKKRHS